MPFNDWQRRFGASRRAKDKAYCQEAERAIAGQTGPDWAKVGKADTRWCDADTRAAIARAFGRPVH